MGPFHRRAGLLAAGVWMLAIGAPAQTAGEFFSEAGRHFAEHRFDRAIASLTECIRREPRHLPALRLLGLCHQIRKEYPEAEAAFRRATGIAPADADAWFFLARVYYLQNYFDKSLDALRTALGRGSRDPRVHEIIGLVREALGEPERAVLDHQQAVARNAALVKPWASPHISYGALLAKLNRPEESEKQLLRARELDPSDWLACFELAKLYYLSGRFARAAAQLHESLEAGAPEDEERARAYRLLSQTYYRLGREEEGRRALDLARKLKP